MSRCKIIAQQGNLATSSQRVRMMQMCREAVAALAAVSTLR